MLGYYKGKCLARARYPNIAQTLFILHTPTCLWRWNRVLRNVGI